MARVRATPGGPVSTHKDGLARTNPDQNVHVTELRVYRDDKVHVPRSRSRTVIDGRHLRPYLSRTEALIGRILIGNKSFETRGTRGGRFQSVEYPGLTRSVDYGGE